VKVCNRVMTDKTLTEQNESAYPPESGRAAALQQIDTQGQQRP
jgi:hypothetical protein